MIVKDMDLHINIEQWNSLPDETKVQQIKIISELVTHNAYTKTDIVFLLKESVRLAEAGAFR